MFPIPWNFPFRKKDGSLVNIDDAMQGGGGSDLPSHTIADAGKVLTVGEDGELEWHESGGAGGPVYIGLTVPSSDLGEDGEFYMQYKNIYNGFALIPVQLDNTNSFASNQSIGPAYQLFDGNYTTFWSTAEGVNTNQYCGFDFGENGAVVANYVGITPREWNEVIQIHDFKIQASNDNETWIDLYSGTMPNDPRLSGHTQYFNFDNSTAYRYYRLFVVDANTSKTITIFEMQLYLKGDTVINIEEVATYKKVSGSWIEVT